MKNLVRNLLSIRKQRRAPPAGGLPKIGAVVTLGELRMKVNIAITDELWNWMVLSGWRKVPVKNDRRKCIDLPLNTLPLLADAAESQRDALQQRILQKYTG